MAVWEPLSSGYCLGQNVTTLDGYVRVSRVGGREGPSFISPDVQRQQISRWADLREVEIATFHTDLDQTGGKLERPGLDEALRRIRSGQSGGIAVARLDRLSRAGVADALRLVEQIHAAGGQLAAIDLGIDPTTPFGEFALTIMLGLARMQRRTIAESWQESRRRAVERGVHVASRTPTGYRAGAGGLLEPDEAAEAVRAVFRAKARGASWRECARILEAAGVPTPYGSPNWTNRSLAHLISNRAYLGEARSGPFTNPRAHPAIVDRAAFEAAQRSRSPRFAPRGGALLSGLLRCAGCSYVMKADHMRARDGSKVRLYRCRGRHALGECSARASVLGSVIEPWVVESFFDHVGELRLVAVKASKALAEAEQEARDAEAELVAFRDSEAAAILGDRFADGLRERAERLDAAEARVAELRAQAGIGEIPDEVELRAIWPDLSIHGSRQSRHRSRSNKPPPAAFAGAALRWALGDGPAVGAAAGAAEADHAAASNVG